MKIAHDTYVFAERLIQRRICLVLVGLSLLPGLFGNVRAVAQLQLGPDAGAAVHLAKQAPEVLPGPSVVQGKNVQAEGEHSEIIKKALGEDAAEQKGAGGTAKESQQAPVPRSEVVEQINAIRRQMGGGIAEQLDGLFDDSDRGREQLQQEFDRELKQLVAKPRPAEGVSPVLGQPRKDAANRLCMALRNAARELDSVAADLEDNELYQAADKVRASATNLRTQARKMVFSQSSNARQVGRDLSMRGPSRDSPKASSQSPRIRPGLPANGLDPKIRPRQ